jgi:hypothetical protein
MGEDTTCSCEEKHQGHLCVLRCKEMTGEIARTTGFPNVVCFNCGEEANSKDNVCSPVQLFV